MSKPVITVENLSKAYRIGLKEEIPDTIVGAMTGWLKAPLRNWKRLRSLDTGRLRSQVSGFRCQVSDGNGDGKSGSSSSSPTPDTRHLDQVLGIRFQVPVSSPTMIRPPPLP